MIAKCKRCKYKCKLRFSQPNLRKASDCQKHKLKKEFQELGNEKRLNMVSGYNGSGYWKY